MFVPKISHKWHAAQHRELRIYRAETLISIFELAYEQKLKINNHGYDAKHKQPTPLMIFYLKMTKLIFQESDPPDLPGILKEARKRHQRK
jgi:hypothetical protein